MVRSCALGKIQLKSELMTTRRERRYLVVAMSAALLAGALAWFQARAAASLAAAREDAELSAVRARRQLATIRDRLVHLGAHDAAKATGETRPPPSLSARSSADGFPAWVREISAKQDDPGYQLQRLSAAKRQLPFRFGTLYRQLGLSPEQIAAFETNVATREEKMTDLGAAVAKAGASWSDPAIGNLAARIWTDYRTAQRTLLGDSGFAALSNYERALPAREIAGGLAGAATVAGLPLTGDQAEQLAAAIAQASPPYQKGGDASMNDIDWNAVDAKARGFLLPDQIALIGSIDITNGTGGRYWSRLNAVLSDAKKNDPVLNPKTPGTTP